MWNQSVHRPFDLVMGGGLFAEQMADKIVPTPPHEIRGQHAVRVVRAPNEVEVFIGFDQLVDQLDRHCRVYVVIQIAVDEQQLPFQVGGVGLVGGRPEVVGPADSVANHQTLVLLGPPDVVARVVVIAGPRHSYLEKIRISKDGVG